MTARPFWDPVTGAAIAHLGLRILPALPCPTCGGSGGSLGPNEWQGWRPCPDCNGSGVWTPPDSPVPIGVTSARPEVGAHDGYIVCSVIPKGYVPDYEADDDDFDEAPGRGLMTNDEWAHKFDDISNHNPPHPIVLSSMIGEGTLRPLKAYDTDWLSDHGLATEGEPHVAIEGDRLLLCHYTGFPVNEWDERDISSALPFLPGLKPRDTVYLLDGFTESVECPEPVAEPHFLIEMSEHAQLEWDDENDCSKEGRGLSLDLVVSATERRSLIPTGYDFDLPATEEGWTEIVAAMHRWADGRGFNFIEPTTDFVLDPTSPGANAAVHLFRAGRLSCPFPVDAPDHPCVQP